MKVLICGGAGFIGSAIAERLTRQGHTVVRGVRSVHLPAGDDQIAVDFTRDLTVEDWLPRLAGIDVVINAVGILVEQPGQSFAAVHRDAPIALFLACAQAGIRRVIQVSALGADKGGTPYFTTKRAADEFLMQLPLNWQIVRPALIYGDTGASATFFRTLASLPIIPLPAGGHQLVQPLHIDDLVAAVLTLIAPETPGRQCVELVGATVLEYRDMLRTYRTSMGFAPAPAVSIPGALIGLTAKVLDHLPGSMLTSDTWKMLQEGNTGDLASTMALLGRMPRGADDFIRTNDAALLRANALSTWRGPLLRLALAMVWILTAIISVFVYPVSDSLALLEAVGLTGSPSLVALYGSAAIDLALGIATIARPGRRLWLMQILLIVTYSVIIIFALPEFLVHPFGPVLKNLPILALLIVLISEEHERKV